jgi:putative hydrolase of the HAD superfamily
MKTIFFDFGGCIDAPGIHTRTLFWNAFREEGLAQDRVVFQEAYTRADQQMMRTGEAKDFDLSSFNRHNARLIAQDPAIAGISGSDRAADRVTYLMQGYIEHSREALVPLREKFELGLISNFTGNLEVILREFAIREFFTTVAESFYVGVSKPEERIFRAALGSRSPAECVYVGDNPVNDIAPAKKLGMQAVLIHPPGQKKECAADFYVEDLFAFSAWIQSK